ncbi:MAG: hypothetical protein QOH89_3651 [Pseudonocardiales bacterium]|nr:hypothetical protein [Pseudonocardiales bacterium]
MRILLVEDEVEVRALLRVGLKIHTALEVVGEAETAASGAAMAKRLQPQVILLDLRLPDSAPRDTFATVRAAAPGSRVVIYSAKESSRRWYEQQGAAFFGKSTDQLATLLDWCRREAERGD